jgi:hypothetical protein
VGGGDEMSRVVFYNLEEAKIENNNNLFQHRLTKIKKLFITDYKHQDIYMTKQMFATLLKESTVLNEKDNLNPLESDILVNIQHKKKREELYCLV